MRRVLKIYNVYICVNILESTIIAVLFTEILIQDLRFSTKKQMFTFRKKYPKGNFPHVYKKRFEVFVTE